MINSSKKTVELEIPSELGYEKIAMAAAAAIAGRMGFSFDRIEDLKTAVGEAVINAIEHGNQLNGNATVTVVLTSKNNALVLHIIDCGYQPIPPIPPERELRLDNRGWGMFLIKSLVDNAETVAQPGRNEMKMIMHLAR